MKTNKNNQGRWCVIRDSKSGNSMVEAIVVNNGVRIQTGEHFGEKRITGEFELLELVESRPIATESIGLAWVQE